jgi:hypothetical protein
MRHSESGKGISKKRRKKGVQPQKKRESVTIAARKDTSPKNTDYPRPITRKPTIPKRNEDEKFRKSLN